MSGGFTAADYERISAGARRSAEILVPLLNEVTSSPRRVVDVGCGEGWFAKAFVDLGAFATGIDAARPSNCQVDDFVEWDLTRSLAYIPLPIEALSADVVVCLEVAEHLPAERGPGLVSDLVALAPTVVWSSAIPGQGGHQHINERWLSYWAGLFAERGYRADVAVRERIWDDDRVEPWYRQNLVVFRETIGRPPGGLVPPMLDVVHPAIFGWKLEALQGR